MRNMPVVCSEEFERATSLRCFLLLFGYVSVVRYAYGVVTYSVCMHMWQGHAVSMLC